MKRRLGCFLSLVLYWLGDMVSRWPMDRFPDAAFPVYEKLMRWSFVIDRHCGCNIWIDDDGCNF